MRGWRTLIGSSLLLTVVFAGDASAQRANAGRLTPLGPGSEADVRGGGKASFEVGTPDTQEGLLATANGSPVFGPPAGNVIFLSRVNASGANNPVILNAANGYQDTVFSQEFTTAPGTTYLELTYSAQVAISNGTAYDGVAFDCKVYQGVGYTSWVPCSATKEIPYLVRQLNIPAPSVQVMASYSGFVRVDPSTPTKVEIRLKTLFSTVGVAAYNNLIIRY